MVSPSKSWHIQWCYPKNLGTNNGVDLNILVTAILGCAYWPETSSLSVLEVCANVQVRGLECREEGLPLPDVHLRVDKVFNEADLGALIESSCVRACVGVCA